MKLACTHRCHTPKPNRTRSLAAARRQASYLSNFKVEAEVKQLKPIKIEASYNESNEASIIEALAAQMM